MKLLDYEGLRDKGIPHSACQIWRWVKAKKFPAPVKLGSRNGWPEHEIDEWIEAKIAERDGAAA